MTDASTQAKTIDQTVLDKLWNFADPQLSAERFRDGKDDASYSEEARAELATQLARALGLQGRFDDGDAVLDAIQSDSHVVAARIALERGRLRNAEKKPDEAVPLFTKAAREAASGDVSFLVLDALHMLAITDTGHEEEWSEEGLAVLDKATQPRTRRWGVALHNNLAWHLHDTGRPDEALPHFEQALEFARTVGTSDQRFLARWAIARCLRTLGRNDEALALQQSLAEKRPDDRYVAAEIAVLTAERPSEDTSTIEA
ncbi:tetratricopeptide repeat protein [Luethyella okanaganae]|uniref:Tetratricopeptide repeat protein n=1 Tax=Luethyella okanaganae TaxID=69372 RepID=A0ABW1VE56_9MICO